MGCGLQSRGEGPAGSDAESPGAASRPGGRGRNAQLLSPLRSPQVGTGLTAGVSLLASDHAKSGEEWPWGRGGGQGAASTPIHRSLILTVGDIMAPASEGSWGPAR